MDVLRLWRVNRERYYQEKCLRIFWLTDVHIIADTNEDPNAPGAVAANRLFYASPAKIRTFVKNVNEALPQLAICSGDITDRPANSFAVFQNIWNTIDPQVRKEVTLGNHDVTLVTHDFCATELGYDDRPLICGSKFNQSFSLTKNDIAVRVIMVDTNINDSGEHEHSTVGHLQSDALEWLETEINNANEKLILIFGHHGPHLYPATFEESEVLELQSIVDSAVASNPEKRVVFCFGHTHYGGFIRYSNLGNLKGILGAACVDYNPGHYTIINITPSLDLELQLRTPFYI